MAEVRDFTFSSVLFEELGLPIDKIKEELNDFFCSRYLTSLYLYEDVAVPRGTTRIPCRHRYKTVHTMKHTDSQLSKVRYLRLSETYPVVDNIR